MNQDVDKDNKKATGKGNGRYRNFCRYSRNEFWKNIGCLISAPTSGLGGSSMWEKVNNIYIIEKKRKIFSILIKVDLYEVSLSYFIYCLLFYFMTVLITFFRQICGIFLTRVKYFRKYWPKGLLIPKFRASGNALLSSPELLLGGRKDGRTDVRPTTCDI